MPLIATQVAEGPLKGHSMSLNNRFSSLHAALASYSAEKQAGFVLGS